jgi:hypothetical protein
MQQLLIEIKSTKLERDSSVSTPSIDQNEQIDSLDTKPSSNPSDLFYDMQPKNFDADQVEHIFLMHKTFIFHTESPDRMFDLFSNYS